tara:strand:- start:41 stop:268 length:228 start_codon:yes stop_codon:yes gene_type:complete
MRIFLNTTNINNPTIEITEDTYLVDNQKWTATEVQEQAYEYVDLNNERQMYFGKGETDFVNYLKVLSDYGHKVTL